MLPCPLASLRCFDRALTKQKLACPAVGNMRYPAGQFFQPTKAIS